MNVIVFGSMVTDELTFLGENNSISFLFEKKITEKTNLKAYQKKNKSKPNRIKDEKRLKRSRRKMIDAITTINLKVKKDDRSIYI